MNIVFRADASLTIGTGHVSRCLTLAESLKRRGAHITFICATGSPAFVPRLAEVADAIIELPHLAAEVEGSSDDTWLTVLSEIDAKATIAALGGRPVDWLVVDHYGIDASWESQLRPFVDRVMVIDDLANRRHDCDALLDQNLYADMNERYLGMVPHQCKLYLGPDYAILRNEFTSLRCCVNVRTGPAKNLLLAFGGVDSANATGLVLDGISTLNLDNVEVNVVIGAKHPFSNNISAVCARHDYRLHVQTAKMAQLIAEADIAIGAGGASTWERATLGLPTLTVVTAPNQLVSAQYLDELGISPLLGIASELTPETVRTRIAAFLADASAMSTASRRSLAITSKRSDPSSIIMNTQ